MPNNAEKSLDLPNAKGDFNAQQHREITGASERVRTFDLMITNHLLCQLSYRSIRMAEMACSNHAFVPFPSSFVNYSNRMVGECLSVSWGPRC